MGGATTKILCFGDSLTAGYYMKGHMFHPYTIKLQSLLNKDGNYQLENQGRSGEGTTKMAERLKLHLSNNPSKYKYAIILGGTNDIGFKMPDMVNNNLKLMHDLCRDHGIISLAVTVPQHGQESAYSWITTIRSQINHFIGKYCKQNNISVIDFSTRIPYTSPNDGDGEIGTKIWDDNLHLTPAGYDLLADLIYESLKPLLLLHQKD
eukprot:TRINITY_DN4459_c0_g1_i1.p1 TRINITY_DN4459_c0_g1~~TRINITY_DN4459_c0_g1_i1.p1  ORF type:complete len:207 (-),score=34.08 TRINITY_DN4459_c0_g1_i1:132-752(-)